MKHINDYINESVKKHGCKPVKFSDGTTKSWLNIHSLFANVKFPKSGLSGVLNSEYLREICKKTPTYNGNEVDFLEFHIYGNGSQELWCYLVDGSMDVLDPWELYDVIGKDAMNKLYEFAVSYKEPRRYPNQKSNRPLIGPIGW